MSRMAAAMWWQSREMAQGWAISVLVHGVLVLTAVTALPRLTVLDPQETFKWQVALVEPAPEARREEPPPSVVNKQSITPAQPARSVEPLQETVMARVAPQQSAQVVHPTVDRVKPAEPMVESIASPALDTPVTAPAKTAEPVVPPSHAAVAEPPVESQPLHHEPVRQALAGMPARPAEISPLVSASVAPSPVVTEPPVQVAKAVVPGTDAKADIQWVGDSLRNRVAELQRYPVAARMNGLEGKVIVKVVILSDGSLADVAVKKSSGHHELDAAALETVRQATPLLMTQPLKKSEVVINLPIVYSLSN